MLTKAQIALFAGAVIFSTGSLAQVTSKVGVKPAESAKANGTLSSSLAASGQFGTFLELMKIAGIQDDTVRALAKDGVTVLAPNDASFSAMPPGKLDALLKDAAKARAFVLGHMLPGKVMVLDMFDPTKATSTKTFADLNGSPVGLLCDGHTGMHFPRINGGKARIAALQDFHFEGGVLHEINGIVSPD